jgi:hypothetical protein
LDIASPPEGEERVEPPAKSSPEFIMRNVTFEDDVRFLRAALPVSMRLHNVRFKKGADFTDMKMIAAGDSKEGQRFGFSYVRFNEAKLSWAQLPAMNYWRDTKWGQPRSAILKDLEYLFRRQKQLEDANTAFYHYEIERQKEQRVTASEMLGLQQGESLWSVVLNRNPLMSVRNEAIRRALVADIKWLLWGLPAGYGTKLWRLAGISLLINAMFAILLMKMGSISWRWSPQAKGGSWIRIFDLPSAYFRGFDESFAVKAKRKPFFDALRLSSLLLFKLGRGEVIVEQKTDRMHVRWLLRLEWLMGYFTVAALLYTLSNTQPLLKGLITAIF